MKTLVILVLVAASAFGDIASFAKPNGETEIKPQAIPATLTTVVTGDVHLTNLVIIVASGMPTITVQDKQGVPVPLLSAITTSNGTTYFLLPACCIFAQGDSRFNRADQERTFTLHGSKEVMCRFPESTLAFNFSPLPPLNRSR